MTLPTLTLPTYSIELPSTEEMVDFRPFIVKEEKILLIALEGGEYEPIVRALKDMVNTCTFEKLEIDKLPVFDLCFLFLNIRAKSVGEIIEPSLICAECSEPNPVKINIAEMKVTKKSNHTNKIDLGEGVGILMKYPVLLDEEEKGDVSISLIVSCIEMIYDGEQIYKSEDRTKEELVEFIENLTHNQFENIIKFYDTMPELKHIVKYKCSKCDKANQVVLEGLGDFFL